MTQAVVSLAEGKPGFFSIKQTLQVKGTETILYVAAWRPGRYEESNYAKNIRSLFIKDEQGNELDFSKKSKNSWQVSHEKSQQIQVEFEYYAVEINAGSSYASNGFLYLNPVNCILFTQEIQGEPFRLKLLKDKSLVYAGDRTFLSEETEEVVQLDFPDFDTLADTPFFCSRDVISLSYKVRSYDFFIHFTGLESVPDKDKILDDFSRFTAACIEVFGELPVSCFHFLVIATAVPFYHGVEHLRSTVIVLGPDKRLFEKELYDELLGVSCHELFHVWNVKTIRPAAMLPYDFSKPVFSDAGLVYEGITTYYGDRLLYDCGVYNEKDYLYHLGKQFQKHIDNPGRFNLSIAQSSIDTWVDGYVKGIPGRKVSIYAEGCLLACIADSRIRELTRGNKTLHDVVKLMFHRFGKNRTGYELQDYRQVLEEVSGVSWEAYFARLVYRPASLEDSFDKALESWGWKIEQVSLVDFYLKFIGCRTEDLGRGLLITEVADFSPAALAGCMSGDILLSVNGVSPEKAGAAFMDHPSLYFSLQRAGRTIGLEVKPKKGDYFRQVSIVNA